MPGELAAKLAIAIAAEISGDAARAVNYYDAVSRTDPNYATAVFGLARCLAASGKRDEAVAALVRIAQTSSLYDEAQKAIARTLIREKPNMPGPTELEKASATVEALMLEGVERLQPRARHLRHRRGLTPDSCGPLPRSSSRAQPGRHERQAWAREARTAIWPS